MTEDWSFADVKQSEKLWGPHGYHRYPAKFIPPLVHRLITSYSTPGASVGDPFLGSATTGVEALRLERSFYGSDVSQVALLMSRVKCTPLYPSELNSVWLSLNTCLQETPYIGRRALTQDELEFINAIDIARAIREERLMYWFPVKYRESLAYILQQILAQEDEAFRLFFLCGFSNILRRCSIWLSGSVKAQKDLKKVLGDPLEEFRKQIHDMLKRNQLYWEALSEKGEDPMRVVKRCYLSLEDARLLPLADAALDLIVTSPPYAICYEYSELHQLTQLWLEDQHVFEPECVKARWIGSSQLAHRVYSDTSTSSTVANVALTQLAEQATEKTRKRIHREVRALRYYFQDMSLALQECARVTKPGGYAIFIVGNSYKRGITIPTSDALCEIAQKNNFYLHRKIIRKIPSRMLVSTRDQKTGRFSSVAESDTLAYPEEDVAVFAGDGIGPEVTQRSHQYSARCS